MRSRTAAGAQLAAALTLTDPITRKTRENFPFLRLKL